ncbi:hypothetical protein K2X85_19690 [bacterium]|nr:hypothetical protein [bacterium]
MCLTYIEYAIIVAMDDIDVSPLTDDEEMTIWDIYEDWLNDHRDDDLLRFKIDSLIHSQIQSIATNLVTVGEWEVACVMLHLRNGTRRYTEVACRQAKDGSIRVFAATKSRGVTDVDCPCVPVMFRADGWSEVMPPHWSLIGLNMESLQEVFERSRSQCPKRSTVGHGF